MITNLGRWVSYTDQCNESRDIYCFPQNSGGGGGGGGSGGSGDNVSILANATKDPSTPYKTVFRDILPFPNKTDLISRDSQVVTLILSNFHYVTEKKNMCHSQKYHFHSRFWSGTSAVDVSTEMWICYSNRSTLGGIYQPEISLHSKANFLFVQLVTLGYILI